MPLEIQSKNAIDSLTQNQLLHLSQGDAWGTGCDASLTTDTTDITVDITSGTVLLGGTSISVNAQTVSLQAGDLDDPRKDLIAVDPAGSCVVLPGTPAPAVPEGATDEDAYQPSVEELDSEAGNYLALWEVWVPADADASTDLDDPDVQYLRDRRLGPPDGDAENIRDVVAGFVNAGADIVVTHNDAGDMLTLDFDGVDEFPNDTTVTFGTENASESLLSRPFAWDAGKRTLYCSPNGSATAAGTQSDPLTLKGAIDSLPFFLSDEVVIDLYTVPNANANLPATYEDVNINTYRPPIMTGLSTLADVTFLGNPTTPSDVVVANGMNWACYGKGDSFLEGIEFHASVQLNGVATIKDCNIYQRGTYGTAGICVGIKKGTINIKNSTIGEGNVATAINVTDSANVGISGGNFVVTTGNEPLKGGPGTLFTAVSGAATTSANGLDSPKGVGNMTDDELKGVIDGQGVELVENNGRKVVHQGSAKEVYKPPHPEFTKTSVDETITGAWTYDGQITHGLNPAETITESTAPTSFNFSGSTERDVHLSDDVTISNGTTASVTEDVTVELYDGIDTTGTLVGSHTKSVTVAAGSSSTVAFNPGGDVSLDTGTYHIEITTSGTTLSVDSTAVNTQGATYSAGQTATGDLYLRDQNGNDILTIDPITDELDIGSGPVFLSEGGQASPSPATTAPLNIRGDSNNRGLTLQNYDDTVGSATSGGAAYLMWESDSGEKLAQTFAHPSDNEFSIYTRGSALGSGGESTQKRVNLSGDSLEDEVRFPHCNSFYIKNQGTDHTRLRLESGATGVDTAIWFNNAGQTTTNRFQLRHREANSALEVYNAIAGIRQMVLAESGTTYFTDEVEVQGPLTLPNDPGFVLKPGADCEAHVDSSATGADAQGFNFQFIDDSTATGSLNRVAWAREASSSDALRVWDIDAGTDLFVVEDAGNANVPNGTLSEQGNRVRTKGDELAQGTATLSSQSAAVDTGVPVSTTGFYDVAIRPQDGAAIEWSLEDDSAGSGNWVIHLKEGITSIGNPSCGWKLKEV